MRSVMKHSFSQVPRAEIQRSSFDRSHGHKTTFDAGFLVPILVDEVLPGDTFSVNMAAFARMATPIHPVMDNMFMESFFFAVPVRLLWDNWQKFNGEQRNPGDSTSFVVPTATSPAGGYLNSSLQDYMGIPPQVAGIVHSNLFARAYNLIWNEWFRDQNMQASKVVDVDDGPDLPADYVLLRRNKRHDYFTSALPWPQKGDAVQLPLGLSAEVVEDVPGTMLDGTFRNVSQAANFTGLLGPTPFPISAPTGGPHIAGDLVVPRIDPAGLALHADLSTATAATVNQLRQAFQIQRLLERDARGGTRYVEILKAHFGVTSPDARLQRPEYLGGGRSFVNISQVPQTSSTDVVTPQGNLAAFGVINAPRGHGFSRSFTEHCILIGLVSVRADLTYQQGLNRMFKRSTRYDFYWPALSHIGEQTVLQGEIFAQGTAADDVVFGYQERYAEYRYKPSLITGQFRSSFATPLDSWHLSQNFAAAPVLGSTFIQEDPPLDRVVAVPSFPHFIFDAYIRMRCARPMPVFGVPGAIDHF